MFRITIGTCIARFAFHSLSDFVEYVRMHAVSVAMMIPSTSFRVASEQVLDGLILLHLPKLAAHFASEGVVAPMYATAWFMTVFTRDFPVGLTARVLDCFLGDPHGTKILHRVALALLQRAQAELLQADLGDCLVLVRELPKTHCNNPRVLMEEAFKFNLKRVEITNAADTGEDALNKAQAMARATEE